MLNLSEVMLAHHDLGGFDELVEVIKQRSQEERFFRMDVKPPYADTPDNWEDILEGAFYSLNR